MMPKKVGLIAGRGNLPLEVVKEIKQRRFEPVVVGLSGEVDPELNKLVSLYAEIPVGNLEKMIEFLLNNQVGELVFAGKVSKEGIFKGGFDETLSQLLNRLSQKNDDAILGAIVDAFEKSNIKVAKQTDYLKSLLVQSGSLVGELTKAELSDVKLGFKMAKASGGLDIGQSVVVKNGVVLAVEAIEGTDQAIIRGGLLGGANSVVVKVSKPNQDERFDVPTVGKTTLESMIKAKASVLAIEAEKTLVTQKDELLNLAVQNKIKIIAVNFNE